MNSEIKKAIQFLNSGRTILCPTDTLWGISCDATNFDAVEKIFKIKKRDKSKSLIVLVSSFEMLNAYVETIPSNFVELIKSYTEPTTIIYKFPKNLAKNTLAENKSIGIRIVSKGFCHQLIKQFGKPIVSSSANFSKKKTPIIFSEIEEKFKDKVDFIVEKKYDSCKHKPSMLIKIEGNNIVVIRE